MLSYNEMMNTVRKIVTHFRWDTFGILLYNFDDVSKGNSDCSLILAPFYKLDKNQSRTESETFDQPRPEVLREKLMKLKQKSRSKFQGRFSSDSGGGRSGWDIQSKHYKNTLKSRNRAEM